MEHYENHRASISLRKMSTYLLTWNPKRTPFDEFPKRVRQLASGKSVVFRWSCGNRKNIPKNARVFMLRQRADKPGIVGSGRVPKGSYEADHWDQEKQGKKAWYVKVKWDSLLLPEEGLPRTELLKGILPKTCVNSQASGVIVKPENLEKLERRWAAHCRTFSNAPAPPANDVPDGVPAKTKQIVYRFIRDTKTSLDIKLLYGFRCQVCGVRLKLSPGNFYAESHHLQPLGGDHKGPDVQDNILCLCPNHHALFDYFAIPLDPSKLRLRKHELRQSFVDYHNAHFRSLSSS